jgi:signal transduction histidine kinase
MAAAAETLQSHLEFVLDERVGNLTPEQRRFLDVALRYGDRLVHLVEDMRLIALAESGELDLVWSHFDLAVTARAVAEQVWPIAHVEGKGLEVQHDGPVPVDADEPRVTRALLALLSDAVEFAWAGTTVTLVVADGGVELRYEGDQGPSETTLALLEAIVGLHAGDVSVLAEAGVVALDVRLEAKPALVAVA